MRKAIRIQHGAFGCAAIYSIDRPLTIHTHSQFQILLKIGGDDGSVTVRDGSYPLSEMYGVSINNFESHEYIGSSENGENVIFSLLIDPCWLAEMRPYGPLENRFQHASFRITPKLRRLTNLLTAELLHGDVPDAAFVEQVISDIVFPVFGIGESTPGEIAAPSYAPVQTQIDRRIKRSIILMQDNLGDRVNFAEVAKQAGLSRPHFFELFRRNMKMTPHIYLNMLRMEKAQEQLTDKRYNINEIAHNLGFSAQSNFTRFFLDIQGISPKEYQVATSRIGSKTRPGALPLQ